MQVLGVLGTGAERDAAALLRARRREGLRVRGARLPAAGDAALPEERRSFVAAHGALWPDPAYWIEWGSHHPSGPTLSEDEADLLVLAAPDPDSLPAWVTQRRLAGTLPQDPFGRPVMPSVEDGRASLLIGLLGGAAGDQLAAPLAALGDAGERSGIAVRPVRLPLSAAQDLPPGLAGLILPGGSDLASVSAQVMATVFALHRRLPVFGLCLGMQSIATAFAREAGWPDAMPEEVAGPGARRSVVRLPGGRHRLGEAAFAPVAGSRLAALAPDGLRVRMNHRYALAQALPLPPGVLVHRGAEDIAEAIELPGERFVIGLQGHPEFGCEDAMAALWDAFLAAADTTS